MTQTPNLPALLPMSELEKMAAVVVKSRLFGVETPEQALTLMLLAQAEGVHPAIAMRDYHIVEGKPALKADAMLARFQAGGGKIEWEDYSDSKVSARFSHPSSPKPVLIEWSIEAANKVMVYSKKAGGWEPITKRQTWKSYPRQMLKARVISEGVRATNPGVAVGVYTVEETQDFSAGEKDITPSAGLPAAPINPTTGALDGITAERQEIIMATAEAIKKAFAEDRFDDAYGLYYGKSGLDTEERVACWHLLADSKLKSTLKRLHAAKEAAENGTVSVPAKKRLEALIREHKLDREQVKAYCVKAYNKEHFSDLTPAEYTDLEGTLKALKEEQEAA